MGSCQEPKIDVKEFSRNCRRALFEHVIEKEGIDNEKEHLRVIWTKTCRSLFDELPHRWQMFAAIISDKGNKRCYVKFVKYMADFDATKYDSSKPLEEQLKIKSYKPVLDLYWLGGKGMAIRGLMNLSAELKEKYLNVEV